MSTLIILGIIAFVVVVFGAGIAAARDEEAKRTQAMEGMTTEAFVPDKSLLKISKKNAEVIGLAINAERSMLCLVQGETIRHFDTADLIASEVLVDGKMVTRTSRASQFAGFAIGGLLFGGVGSVVGGLSGKTVTQKEVKDVRLRLMVNDLEDPFHVVEMMDASLIRPPKAIAQATEWQDLLSAIIRIKERELASRQPQQLRPAQPEAEGGASAPPQITSIAGEIRKLASLRDEGLLTSEEFERVKNRLLDTPL